jgi:uncharacterized membrane protein YkvI
MKKISLAAYCFSFIGSFLGAGYISGQELYQFFARFGINGIYGIMLAITFLGVTGIVMAKYVRETQNDKIDTVIAGGNAIFGRTVAAVEMVMYFGTYIVMAAGAGALFEKLSGIGRSYIGGSFIFCAVIACIAIKGIDGLVKVFSYIVPLLAVMTVATAVLNAFFYAPSDVVFVSNESKNALFSSWVLGAFLFSSYNLFCGIGVLCPVSKMAKKDSHTVWGIVIGCVVLLIIALCVLYCMAVNPASMSAELPMLEAAQRISVPFMYVYASLLFIAMSGASLSCLVPVLVYFSDHFSLIKKHNALSAFSFSFIAFVISCFGFSNLVATVFSAFGYVSIVIVAVIYANFIKLMHKKRKMQRDEKHAQPNNT